jgi:chaperonin cofactor prefoldin
VNEDLEMRVAALEQDNRHIHEALESFNEWREELQEHTKATKELVGVMKDLVSAMRVLRAVGNAIKWVAGLGAAVAAMWIAVRTALQ